MQEEETVGFPQGLGIALHPMSVDVVSLWPMGTCCCLAGSGTWDTGGAVPNLSPGQDPGVDMARWAGLLSTWSGVGAEAWDVSLVAQMITHTCSLQSNPTSPPLLMARCALWMLWTPAPSARSMPAVRGEVQCVGAGGDREFWFTSKSHPKWLTLLHTCMHMLNFRPCEYYHLLPTICELCLVMYYLFRFITNTQEKE